MLGGALLIAVLLPWNLPIWWQLRRLRFAIEVDCDARVLRGGQSRSTYSAVLLSVATHLVPLRAAAAGLSESGSSLEKRIRIMHAPLRARWRLLAAFLGSCSVAMIAVAANVTAPPVPSLTASYSEDGLPLLPSPWRHGGTMKRSSPALSLTSIPQLREASKQVGRMCGRWSTSAARYRRSIWTCARHGTARRTLPAAGRTYLQSHGVIDSQIRQQLVMQIPIGPNYAVVAWAMQRGAVARDASAPTFEVAPRQAQTTQARMLATVDAQRRVIEYFAPDALSASRSRMARSCGSSSTRTAKCCVRAAARRSRIHSKRVGR